MEFWLSSYNSYFWETPVCHVDGANLYFFVFSCWENVENFASNSAMEKLCIGEPEQNFPSNGHYFRLCFQLKLKF